MPRTRRALLPFLAAAAISFAGPHIPGADPFRQDHTYRLPADKYGCGILPLDLPGIPRTFHVTVLHVDGRTLEGRSRICRESPDDAMRVRIDGRNIIPDSTRLLVAAGDTGRPNSTDWLFPRLRGRITAFSVQPRGPARKASYLEQDGILDPYSDRLLSRLVRDHEEAAACMRRKTWGKYGSWGMAAAAGAMVIAAAVVPGEEEKDPSGFVTRTSYRAKSICVATGIGFLLGGGGWRLATADNHVQAIRAYNADGPKPFRAD